MSSLIPSLFGPTLADCPDMRYARRAMMSPISPFLIRSWSSWRPRQWRTMRPTAVLRFFLSASSASWIMRFEVGPSTATGFSMNTLSPFLIAYWKWTHRNAGGVARIATSPGFRQSMAFW